MSVPDPQQQERETRELRSVNDIAHDIVERYPEAEPFVEEWFGWMAAKDKRLAAEGRAAGGALRRIAAAVESDKDLARLPALRSFLRSELDLALAAASLPTGGEGDTLDARQRTHESGSHGAGPRGEAQALGTCQHAPREAAASSTGDVERGPEELEREAGALLVQAARLRVARRGPDDAHEVRHIGAAIEAGNSDTCTPVACHLDARAAAAASPSTGGGERGRDDWWAEHRRACDLATEVANLREALTPFAAVARRSMERLGLADEYDEARLLVGLEPAPSSSSEESGGER